jgi:hypothetical protein
MSIDGGLSKLFQQNLIGWHWQRIETGGTGRGIPDLNGCKSGRDIWLEMKVTEAWNVGLRPEQIGWALRRVRAGGLVWCAVRQQCDAGRRRDKRDGLWLVPGRYAAELAAEGLKWAESVAGTGAGVLHWSGPGPGRWAWDQVEQALLT